MVVYSSDRVARLRLVLAIVLAAVRASSRWWWRAS
jgi:hypothetical protein